MPNEFLYLTMNLTVNIVSLSPFIFPKYKTAKILADFFITVSGQVAEFFFDTY